MTDKLSTEQRSRNMSRIRSKDTRPELEVRRLLHAMGFRFRLHVKELPGRPDIVFPGRRKVIFVHGCFWHRHEGCGNAKLPKTNRAFWVSKLNANRERDQRNLKALEKKGWSCLVVWECEINAPDLPKRLRQFLKTKEKCVQKQDAPNRKKGLRPNPCRADGRRKRGKNVKTTIPIIDIFAGPGGLGEGFSAWDGSQSHRYDVRLSVEKEPFAHSTLELRTFFREFSLADLEVPEDYYDFLRGTISREELFGRHPKQAESARNKAWMAELGAKEVPRAMVNQRIKSALGAKKSFVLVGGPPCQAYSVVGRSRRQGMDGYDPEKDVRQHLYVEYLQVLADHRPAVFVMENVKGLLSAKLSDEAIFSKILADLRNPAEALRRGKRDDGTEAATGYRLFSLVQDKNDQDATQPDFVVRAEEYGIPQARHRIIILGVRDDFPDVNPKHLISKPSRTLEDALKGLPRLRSTLSRSGVDSGESWLAAIKAAKNALGDGRKLNGIQKQVREVLMDKLDHLRLPPSGNGGLFVEHICSRANGRQATWADEQFADHRIGGVCNHEARGHAPADLHRYLYAACYALVEKRSPTLADFPVTLLPNHKNVQSLLEDGSEIWRESSSSIKFADRFRVQPWGRPCTTVTSHIAKDGHYYIHPDPTQCRSLTVREAARIQTFPDNYFFCGPRTAQYQQVGNAVPPLLAKQIAEIVYDILVQADLISERRK